MVSNVNQVLSLFFLAFSRNSRDTTQPTALFQSFQAKGAVSNHLSIGLAPSTTLP